MYTLMDAATVQSWLFGRRQFHNRDAAAALLNRLVRGNKEIERETLQRRINRIKSLLKILPPLPKMVWHLI